MSDSLAIPIRRRRRRKLPKLPKLPDFPIFPALILGIFAVSNYIEFGPRSAARGLVIQIVIVYAIRCFVHFSKRSDED